MHASVKNTLLATAGAAAALAGSSVVASADSITVKSGDTLYALAAANHVSVDDLVSANKIADANLIHVGQKIELSGSSAAQSAAPAKQETKQVSNNGSYTVKAGDSLWAIANANGMTLSELLDANPDLQASSIIYVGSQVNLSKSAVKSTATVKPAASQADTTVAQSAAASSAAASEANAKEAAAAQSAATSEANAKAVAASSAAVAAENAKTVAAQSAATSEANAKAAAAQSAATSEANAKAAAQSAAAQSAATSEANAKAAAAQSAATSEANAKAAAQSAAAQSAATSEANAKAAAQSAAAQSAATSEANAKAAAQSAATSEANAKAAAQSAAAQSAAAASQAAASQAAASQAAASQAAAQPQHVAATASATTAKPTSVASANIAGNTYPYGQCTWYVKGDLSWVGNNWGNASSWASSATAAGHTVNGTASVGAVAYFAPGVGGASGYGHVAVVDSVNSDGTVTISEANYAGKLYNSRTISTSNVSGFIHQ